MPLDERDRACFGPRDEKVPGSVPWCWQTIDLLKHRWTRKDLTDSQWDETLAELRQHEVWKVVPPEQPYGTLSALLEAEIGRTLAEADQDVQKRLQGQAHPKMGPRMDHGIETSSGTELAPLELTGLERARLNKVSRDTQRKLDFLAGHRDDLYQDVQRGTLSVHAAYQRAKGHVPETPFEVLLRAWRRVKREDRVRFLREMLTEQERAELADELLAIETRAV